MGSDMNGQASEKAISAAVAECARLLNDAVDGNDAAKEALEAAHDPALGLDRSVRLGDVVEALRAVKAIYRVEATDPNLSDTWHDAADLIAREFSEEASRVR